MRDEQLEWTSRTDEQLMLTVRDNDCVHSFELIVQRWQQPVVRLCYRMVGAWEDAEDLTQDVFARLFQSRSRYRATARLSTYLWSIAINRCRDFHRSAEREKERQKKVSDIRSERQLRPLNSTEEAIDRIREALSRLAPRFREVLILRHYEGLTFKEIANVLEIPFGTVASRMAKALKLLGEQLAMDAPTQ